MTRNTIVAKLSALATDGGPFDGRHRGYHRGGGLLVLVVLVVAAVLITWFIARRRTAGAAPRSGNAETILSERLARSEISVDDYRTTLAALREK
jgi:uncharacterized membrane protein